MENIGKSKLNIGKFHENDNIFDIHTNDSPASEIRMEEIEGEGG